MVWVAAADMEEAFSSGDLALAESHLENLITTATPLPLLAKFTAKGLPLLHHLARLPCTEKDIPRLDKFIKVFTDWGYDINKQTDAYHARKRASLGFTALLAAIEQRNLIFMECLLRHGARTDIRDARGFSPCHWAIIVGDVGCLGKLLESGASASSTEMEKSGEGEVHPLLHTAVDEGRTEMVFDLLTKGLVDINEEAIYRGVMSMEAFTRFPSRYNNEAAAVETVDMAFTPLGRAVRMRKIPIIQVLLLQTGIKLSGFNELHFCIVEGDTEVALILLDYFSDEQLAVDKIQDKWALHCLHPLAFRDEIRVEFTSKLILEYVDAGWDVNSSSDGVITRNLSMGEDDDTVIVLTKYTLLHLASIYKSHEIIKLLVEEAGVDVNCRTEGDVEITALQILLVLKKWDSASYLIDNGADLNLLGSFKSLPFTKLVRKNLTTGNSEAAHSSLNAVELLVRLGEQEGLLVLDQVLSKPDVVWQGASEFHLALEGTNPTYVTKVLQHCSKTIDVHDLTWITFSAGTPGECVQETVPTLLWLLHTINLQISESGESEPSGEVVSSLGDLMTLFVEQGYDLNLMWRPPPPPTSAPPVVREPLIIYALRIDFLHKSSLLLRTLLQFDHLLLTGQTVTSSEGRNCVEYLLGIWNERCMEHQMTKCWKSKSGGRGGDASCVDAVKLLVTHGLDVSGGVVIGRDFKYHSGYKPMIQMLYCAGAKIEDEFFSSLSSSVCHPGYLGTRGFPKEISEVERWKQEFDQENQISLRNICRLRIRKMMTRIGHLRMLEELPAQLKNQVLGISL